MLILCCLNSCCSNYYRIGYIFERHSQADPHRSFHLLLGHHGWEFTGNRNCFSGNEFDQSEHLLAIVDGRSGRCVDGWGFDVGYAPIVLYVHLGLPRWDELGLVLSDGKFVFFVVSTERTRSRVCRILRLVHADFRVVPAFAFYYHDGSRRAAEIRGHRNLAFVFGGRRSFEVHGFLARDHRRMRSGNRGRRSESFDA